MCDLECHSIDQKEVEIRH